MSKKYLGVPAAEKYAELEARGLSRAEFCPKQCGCRAVWRKNSNLIVGGHWDCSDKLNRQKAQYKKNNPDYIERQKALGHVENMSPERLEKVREYDRKRRPNKSERKSRLEPNSGLSCVYCGSTNTRKGGRKDSNVRRCSGCDRSWSVGITRKRAARRIWVPGEQSPRCDCHRKPMRKTPSNGRYRCSVTLTEYQVKYDGSEARVDSRVRTDQKRRMKRMAERRKRLLEDDL